MLKCFHSTKVPVIGDSTEAEFCFVNPNGMKMSLILRKVPHIQCYAYRMCTAGNKGKINFK